MLGVCYYPEQWPKSYWRQDAERMKDLGLEVVRVGEFAWSRLEPREGHYEFAWLDEAIDILHEQGLKVVLGTPTATPPRWIVDKFPDMLPVDINTRQARGFGSRRHYDITHLAYRQKCEAICEQLALRYGKHPALHVWQVDNELGCHDTTHSASESSKKAFQQWCRQRYENIEALNSAWGNVFWSMEYQQFEQIDVPFMTVTESNPAHQLAYRRFCSDASRDFVEAQCAMLRQHSPNIPITHNFIPLADTQFDYFDVAKQLDFVSYDSYPLGRSDLFFEESLSRDYLRTGHPDLNSFYLSQTRSLRDAPFWIMEQQPGPVNWANNNPRPKPGMVRLWTFEAIAQGAACVSYFRWRQAAFAQEQMHAGLLRVDSSPSEAYEEVAQCFKEIQKLELSEKLELAEVAIVIDVHNQWVSEIEQQSSHYQYDKVLFDYYSGFRQLGVDCDFISPDSDFSRYKLIIVPSQMMVDDAFVKNCENSTATFLFGPRTGSKTQEFQLEPNLAPGPLQRLLPIKVLTTETLPETEFGPCQWQETVYQSRQWREKVAVAHAEVLCRNEINEPVLIAADRFHYLAAQMDADFVKDLMQTLCQQSGVKTMALAPKLRLVTRGPYGFAFNYADESQEVPLASGDEILIGERVLAPQGVLVWRR